MASAEKVTVMILEVDLKCSRCYKKVRKLLCKFPQIRDQVFDVDKNKVMIKVVCCDPEKLRDKLCRKGGGAIQSIEIVEKPKQSPSKPVENKPKDPEKPQPQPTPEKPKPKEPEIKPKPLEKKPSGKSDAKPPPVVPVPMPKPDPKPDPPPKQPQPQPVKMPDPTPPQPQPQPQNMPMPYPMPMDGYPFCPPVSTCCQECYQGLGGGPCHDGYGRPVPPPPGPCYDGYQYGGNRPCYVSRCDRYFSDDNPQGCSIM